MRPGCKIELLLLAVCLLLVAAESAAAPKTVSVTGETVYYDNGFHSRVECMRLAAEQARIQALAQEFGTTVSQDFLQTDRIKNGRESNDVLALTMTEVRGEWLGDTAEPQYEVTMGADGNLVVKCKVRGNARAISNEAVAFEASVLRNGLTKKHAAADFMDGDDMYLYFLGSEDGYLTVWLEDESATVYNLLPYPRDSKSDVRVKRYNEYTFFSEEKGDPRFGTVDALTLTAPEMPEYNRVYVVFSSNPYSRPVMTAEPGGLPSLAAADFTKWLLKARRTDPKLGVKTMNIKIAPR